MPNTSHGGGISRKISSASDRKRLKSIVDELNLPRSMGCIVRTAGLSRTKPEIKRDFDYLARLWDEIRERTLKGSAPALIHSDSALIKRAIRDIYSREIDEVMVEGEEGYKSAKSFMKLLMPSHARKVKQYADPVPLFQRHGVEDQLSAMYNPVVQLKSGGYIVINPTEALVSIDINSGRSTKEHGIEQTALSTNMEAAKEIARQLRLRDMAGLVVIDFIDMEKHSNSRKVERCLKESLKNDRARIQVGRISSFGLMEMSRQRLRTGVLEASTRECPHCEGTGLVRTASSAGLTALRHIEEEAAKGKGREITLRASQEATIYVLNAKRAELAEIEERYGVSIEILPNSEAEGAKMTVSSSGGKPEKQVAFEPIIDEEDIAEDVIDERDDDEEEAEERPRRQQRNRDREERSEEDEDGKPKRKRRRRGRRGGRGRKREDENGEQGAEGQADDGSSAKDEPEAAASENAAEAAGAEEEAKPKARRGRRRKAAEQGDDSGDASEAKDDKSDEAVAQDVKSEDEAPKKRTRRRSTKAKATEEAKSEDGASEKDGSSKKSDAAEDGKSEEKPKPKRRSRAKKADSEKTDDAPAEEAGAAKPKRRSRAKKAEATDAPEPAIEAVEQKEKAPAEAGDAGREKPNAETEVEGTDASSSETESKADDGPPRRGWWQRTFG